MPHLVVSVLMPLNLSVLMPLNLVVSVLMPFNHLVVSVLMPLNLVVSALMPLNLVVSVLMHLTLPTRAMSSPRLQDNTAKIRFTESQETVTCTETVRVHREPRDCNMYRDCTSSPRAKRL